MKIKISWPQAIVISMAAFVIFILTFVFKATFLPEYDHHLVSEDYYNEELNYQQEIDKMNRGVALKENVRLEKTTDGLMIYFPSDFKYKEISGTIYFKRLSNKKIDFELPIQLNSHEVLIKDADLVEGRWDIRVEWAYDDTEYLLKQKIIY